MADDKGGGSKSWEPFEIVLVLLLAIGFLTQLQNGFKDPATPTKKTTTTPKKTVVTKPATNDLCGLTIARPHSLEVVTSFVTLVGSTTGCNWVPTETTALYAQVIDSYGKSVSAYTPVPAIAGNGTTDFTTTISLTEQPTGKGFIILIPATSTSGQSISTRIPITFSTH